MRLTASLRVLAPLAVCALVGCLVYSTTPAVTPAGGGTGAAASRGSARPAADGARDDDADPVGTRPGPGAGGPGVAGDATGERYYPPPSALAGPRVVRVVAWSVSSWSPRPSWTVAVSSPAPAWRWPRSSPGPAWLSGSHSPDPAWSFDGSRVAFYDGDCISVRRADGSFERTLHATALPPGDRADGCRSPRWSHDGRSIVSSHSFHGPGLVFDVASGRAKMLRPRGDEGLWGLAFAPGDGFMIGRVHQTGVVLVPTTGAPGRVFAVVSDAEPAMTGYFPSLSPDGRWAVRVHGDPFAGSTARMEIIGLDLARPRYGKAKDPWDYKKAGPYDAILGRHAGWVESGGGVPIEHAWAPDGRRLVVVESSWYPGYDSYTYPEGELFVVDVPGGRRRSLGMVGRNPTWSPDGRFIAFDVGPGGGIWIVDASGRGARRILPDGIEPRWSPDGRRLLYQDPHDRVLAVAELG